LQNKKFVYRSEEVNTEVSLATRNSWTFNNRFFSVHPYPAITGNMRDDGDGSFPEIQANAATLCLKSRVHQLWLYTKWRFLGAVSWVIKRDILGRDEPMGRQVDLKPGDCGL